MKLHIIANWMQGSALSGGDRIFIELAKRLSPEFEINLYLSKEGWQICRREDLANFKHAIWANDVFVKFGYFVDYFYRTVNSIINSFRIKLDKNDVIYSSSDFLPDALPAFVLKLRFGLKWIAGFYLFAPAPWDKSSPYKGKRSLIGFFYWLAQLPVYLIVKKFADMVFVTSQPDVRKFITRNRPANKIMVIQGGVDLKPAEEYFKNNALVPVAGRKFDSCFVGRFHYQKGVLELISIWKIVCMKMPDAKLVLIGVGPLEAQIKEKIKLLGLGNNIHLAGFLNGESKYEVFKQSKIVVHPATYDSGGMAAAEAFAWKLPGVSFDLEALRTYYPKGMLKAKCFDLQDFATLILDLLIDDELYQKTSLDAYYLVNEVWNWDKRAVMIKEELSKL